MIQQCLIKMPPEPKVNGSFPWPTIMTLLFKLDIFFINGIVSYIICMINESILISKRSNVQFPEGGVPRSSSYNM